MANDRPMFRRRGLRVQPASRAGWTLTSVYTALALGIAVAVFASGAPPTWLVIAWLILHFSSLIAFSGFAWRHAAAVDDDPGQRRGRGHVRHARVARGIGNTPAARAALASDTVESLKQWVESIAAIGSRPSCLGSARPR